MQHGTANDSKSEKAGMKVKEVSHTSHGRLYGTSVISGVRQAVKQGLRDWFIIKERFTPGKQMGLTGPIF